MSEAYVVRLRTDARDRGEIVGEVEAVDSRRIARVRDVSELVAFMLDGELRSHPPIEQEHSR